jgi:hypothetical protein
MHIYTPEALETIGEIMAQPCRDVTRLDECAYSISRKRRHFSIDMQDLADAWDVLYNHKTEAEMLAPGRKYYTEQPTAH